MTMTQAAEIEKFRLNPDSATQAMLYAAATAGKAAEVELAQPLTIPSPEDRKPGINFAALNHMMGYQAQQTIHSPAQQPDRAPSTPVTPGGRGSNNIPGF